MNKGKVYLMGAGPGDPGLLTLRAAEILRAADLVVYDWLVNPRILEHAPAAEKIYVGKNIKMKSSSSPPVRQAGPQDRFSSFPHVFRRESANKDPRLKSCGDDGVGACGNDAGYIQQSETNKLLLKLAKQGKKVARLKGGDPFIFGRGGEEASYLAAHKIPFEVVPGVSAGHAVPAYAGIPITDRRFASEVTFITGHEAPNKKDSSIHWKRLAETKGTLVSFMGVRTLPDICKNLISHRMSPKTPAALIEWGTLPRQRVVVGTISDIVKKAAKEKIESPSLAVIGNVVKFRRQLKWFEQGPLTGKKVVVTRSRSQASELKEKLEQAGADVFEFPTLEILPPRDPKPLDQAIREISNFDWIIFTSVNGVESFYQRLNQRRLDARIFAGRKIAAIGEATKARLESFGICPDLVPDKFTSQALLEAFKKAGNIHGKSFLLPRTDIAPPGLREGLEKMGAEVTEVIAYHTAPVRQPALEKQLIQELEAGKIDYITFTSSSTVKNFFEAIPKIKRKSIRSRFVSIGPVTSQTLREFGFRPHREASEHTIPGLVKALKTSNGKSKRG